MPAFDSADLKSRLAACLQLGDNSTENTVAILYPLLANAQQRMLQILAAHCPWINISTPQQLLSTDGGYTYQLASYPLGHMEIRDGRNGPHLFPTGDWDNSSDGYVQEGQTIRFPNNISRTFANGLYGRYTPLPETLDDLTAPVLKPVHARQAIVYDAAREYATQGGALDPAPYRDLLNTFLWGDRDNPGDIGLIGALKSQSFGQGVAASTAVSGGNYWWRGQGWAGGS